MMSYSKLPSILALGMGLLVSFRPGPDPAGPVATLKFLVRPVGAHHLLIARMEKAPQDLFVLDWGKNDRPGLRLPQAVGSIRLEQDGKDLVLVAKDLSVVRFTVRTDAQAVSSEVLVPVIGISELQDKKGFDMAVLSGNDQVDAFALANAARLK